MNYFHTHTHTHTHTHKYELSDIHRKNGSNATITTKSLSDEDPESQGWFQYRSIVTINPRQSGSTLRHKPDFVDLMQLCWSSRFIPTQVCPRYDTKLRLMLRHKSRSIGKYGPPSHCHYSLPTLIRDGSTC